MAKAYLSLGSNLGDRKNYLFSATEALKKITKITKISSLYETKPWGKTDQPMFLNLCLICEVSQSPGRLLNRLKKIERQLGRTQSQKWDKRQIDIDILFYDSLVLSQPGLIIPHPQIEQRAFALVPLNEIARDLIHPALNKTIAQLTKAVDKSGVVKISHD